MGSNFVAEQPLNLPQIDEKSLKSVTNHNFFGGIKGAFYNPSGLTVTEVLFYQGATC